MGYWFTTDQEIINALKRIEGKVDRLLVSGRRVEEMEMTEHQELEALKQRVAQNTDIVASAAAALTGYMQTVAGLTTQLQEAVADDDSEAIKEASDAIAANNAKLQQAIPAVAEAVKANT